MKTKSIIGMVVAVVFVVLLLFTLGETQEKNEPRGRVPVGTIVPYGGPVSGQAKNTLAQQGWLICDGDRISHKEYPELFEAIGTFFGGDGNPNFNLPDLRGRFVRGVDHGVGRDSDAKDRKESNPGGTTGDKVGSVQDDAFQGHGHETNAINGSADKSTAMRGLTWNIVKRIRANVGSAITDEDCDGARISKETRPKNIYVNWIICAR